MQITEYDWKVFRRKLPGWQETYMERLVSPGLTSLKSL